MQGSSEVFFRKVKFWDKGGRDAPPVFNVDGVNYLHVKVSWKLSAMKCRKRLRLVEVNLRMAWEALCSSCWNAFTCGSCMLLYKSARQTTFAFLCTAEGLLHALPQFFKMSVAFAFVSQQKQLPLTFLFSHHRMGVFTFW